MNKIKTIFKNKISFGIKYIPYLVIAVLVGVTVTYAGSLTPPGAPAKTMKSLSDLYELVNTGANTPATDFTTPATVSATMNSIEDIYDLLTSKIAAIPADQILTGTTIFGVDGTATGAPTLTWQTPDPALALCWSHGQYEIDNGCTVGSGFTQTPDTLTTLGAKEYCQYLNSDGTTLANTAQNIWHLPTIQEYTSITDYTRFNNATVVIGFTEGTNYWSSTQNAEGANSAWYWYTWYGNTNLNGKTNQFQVRCVR